MLQQNQNTAIYYYILFWVFIQTKMWHRCLGSVFWTKMPLGRHANGSPGNLRRFAKSPHHARDEGTPHTNLPHPPLPCPPHNDAAQSLPCLPDDDAEAIWAFGSWGCPHHRRASSGFSSFFKDVSPFKKGNLHQTGLTGLCC